jgi:hypothetical protein
VLGLVAVWSQMAPITDQGALEKAKPPPNTTKNAQTALAQRNRAPGDLKRGATSENASENARERTKIDENAPGANFPSNKAKTRASSASATQRGPQPLAQSISWWERTEDEQEDSGMADGFQKSRKTARSPIQVSTAPPAHSNTAKPSNRFSSLNTESAQASDSSDNDGDASGEEPTAMPSKSAQNGPNNGILITTRAPPTTSAPAEGNETSCEDAQQLALQAYEWLQREYTDERTKNPSFTEITVTRELLRSVGFALFHAHKHLQHSLNQAPITPGHDCQQANDKSDTDYDTETHNALHHVHNRINGMEKNIEEIKALLTTMHHCNTHSNETTQAQRTTTQPQGTEAPRTYANAVTMTSVTQSNATPTTAPPRRAKIKALRKDQAASDRKNAVTLSTRHASDEAKEAIANMPHHTIARKLQTAITKEVLKAAKGREPPKVVGIGKLENTIRIQLGSEEDANAVPINDIDWSEALGTTVGIKPHTPSYAIVVHDLRLSNSSGIATERDLRQVEINNNMATGTIDKITNLYRTPHNRAAVIMYLNCPKQANKSIKEGVYVKYVYYRSVERFFPQTQITQCYNCHEYGHQAVNCTVPTRCGRCGDEHETKECKATMPKCLHCHEGHEAWNIKCEVRIAERERGRKKLEKLPIFFNEAR